MNVVPLFPSPETVDAAWQAYVALCTGSDREPALRVDPDHQVATVRAWARWRDLFLAQDRRAVC